ncbi:zinc finger protein 830 [Carcharodon carcharias]|uniref:zinc finger protein 830 n=1 Tax=Carcharodon carcharias TaxID=13397 RepID=UPI001B7EC52E|nr:zinc finger protein 830 [Carcharodon carcharias]
MAAPTKKKIVNQQELRRLMKEKQRAAAGNKRIESPLAKYNSLGHLSCVLCSTPIKNELLWQTHILGKQHKENLEKQKTTKQTTGPSLVHTSTAPVGKRKVTDAGSQATKKIKAFCESRTPTASGLLADCIDPGNKVPQQPISSQHSGLSLGVDDYEEDDDDMEEEDKKGALAEASVGVAPLQKNAALPAPVQTEAGHGLPADFFDSTVAPSAVPHSASIQKPEQSDKTVERKENTAEALPEGFFDDPVKDAKVRKVDPPKDQMDKEWEEFQKEMRQVNTVSEAIVAEDDEEVRLDRQIEEIDEQIMCYRRIEHLRDRQETVKQLLTALKGRQSQGDDDVDTDEEEEFQEFLSGDWRAKGALL